MTTNLFAQAMGVTGTSEAGPSVASHYFGEVDLDLQQVALIRGVGRVPYAPDDPSQRGLRPSLEISISLHCEDRNGTPYSLRRAMLAMDKRQPDWIEVTLPSLQALGVGEPSDIHGKFAHVELVQTGTYTDRQGVLKRLTAFRFVELFGTELEMHAARDLHFADRANGHANGATVAAPKPPQARTNGNGHTPKPLAPVAAPKPAQARASVATGTPVAGNSDRAAALKVAETLWQTALHTDDPVGTLETLMKDVPVVKQAGITVEDQAVQEWISRDLIPF
ncbi:MAG: hypothetical protein HC911_15890 [Chloroflexaceae bacterium]|nr:hypothetical protein [Chloroflexaceae bacterium]